MTMQWLSDALTPTAEDPTYTPSEGAIPVGIAAQEFIKNGAPMGEQRTRALATARNLLGAGYDIDAAAELIWRGLQESPNDPADPWTWEETYKLTRNIAESPPKPIRPLQRAELIINIGRKTDTDGAMPDTATPAADGQQGQAGECSDVGNSAWFRALWTGKVLYDHRSCDWWLYKAHYWERDADGEVMRLARETIRQRQINAVSIPDDDARAREMKWAAGSLSRKRIADMLTLAQSEPGIADAGEGWDADPLLIAFENGIYDAHTHTFRDGKPEDRIRTHAPTMYDPAATAPVFARFISEVAPAEEVRELLQRFLGYSMTGDVSEQKMMIGIGPRGSNGKTTLAECIAGTMGPYARAAAPEMLLTRKHDAHPTELADLQGARLVTSIEVEHGRRLAESRVKHLTGGDVIKARKMRENFSHFAPTHKLLLLCNHMPVITSSDEAIWRRLLIVEFSAKFADRPGPGERKTDPHLGEKLAAERSGIANWLIEGLKEWQARRLDPPDAVIVTTAAYRASADPLATFFEDSVVIDPDGYLQPSLAYIAYRRWAANRWQKDSETISETVFGTMMGERFPKRKISVGGAQVRAYIGLRLLDQDGDPNAE